MTREQAKSELMQIYMSLSEEKKKALDVAFKAMEQTDGECDFTCKYYASGVCLRKGAFDV